MACLEMPHVELTGGEASYSLGRRERCLLLSSPPTPSFPLSIHPQRKGKEWVWLGVGGGEQRQDGNRRRCIVAVRVSGGVEAAIALSSSPFGPTSQLVHAT